MVVPLLARLAALAAHPEATHGGELASKGVCALLDLQIAPPSGKTRSRWSEGNKDRICYPRVSSKETFRWPGVIEAGCKTVIGSRLKPSGISHHRPPLRLERSRCGQPFTIRHPLRQRTQSPRLGQPTDQPRTGPSGKRKRGPAAAAPGRRAELLLSRLLNLVKSQPLRLDADADTPDIQS